MNRAETFLATYQHYMVAIRSRYGTKVHAAYAQGPTFCGIRRPAMAVSPANVADDRCCDKCFPMAVQP